VRGTDESERFRFGKNWTEFARSVTAAHLDRARLALAELVGTDDLSGKTFLDVGCGSGIHSLAAHNMGAAVIAFDFDRDSVSTAIQLRDAHVLEDPYPVITGSILDTAFLSGLGRFDVVYAWGVLHPTGAMWQAFDNVAGLVGDDGCLVLAIYNDQGIATHGWRTVKRMYVQGGPVVRWSLIRLVGLYFTVRAFVAQAVKGRRYTRVERRGMERRYDLVDWVGGYPFEVAKPEQVFDYFLKRGFELRRLTTAAGGHGCNEFRFERRADYKS
jgi:2-polyprenyl-3-methyl-5-hydroxy-6-metoxy-1,4-benzoquinol methylase